MLFNSICDFRSDSLLIVKPRFLRLAEIPPNVVQKASFVPSFLERYGLVEAGSHLFPILSGRLAEQPFENDAHVFGMFKSRKFGNSFQSKIRFRQQLFDAADLDPSNFRLRRTFQVLAKPPF